MALGEKHRSALYQGLRSLVDEEAVEALLAEFPNRDEDRPATKDYVHAEVAGVRGELKAGLADVRREMATEFANVRNEMATEFANVRNEMASEFANVRSEMASEFANVHTEFANVRAEMAMGFTSLRTDLTKEIGDKLDALRKEMNQHQFLLVGAVTTMIGMVEIVGRLVG